jgi:hypothetical protein
MAVMKEIANTMARAFPVVTAVRSDALEAINVNR